MGITYHGPYVAQLAEHEGYTDHRMRDGSFSGGTTSARYPQSEQIAAIAACACGMALLQRAPADAGR